MEIYQISDSGLARLAAPQDSILVIGEIFAKPGKDAEIFGQVFSECLLKEGRIGGLETKGLGVRYEGKPCAYLRPSRVVWMDYNNPALLRAMLGAERDAVCRMLGPGCAKMPPLAGDPETDALFSGDSASIIQALSEKSGDRRVEKELSVFFERGTGEERNIFRDAARAINVVLPKRQMEDRTPELAAWRAIYELGRASREI